MSVITLPALLLRAHAYSESSRIFRFLTPTHGVVGVMARGVRTRSSRGGSALETFSRGELTLDMKEGRELHGFRDFRPGPDDPRRLGRGLLPLAAASYLGELVLAHAMESTGERGGEGDPQVFHRLVEALEALEHEALARVPGVFLAAAWGILGEFGFSPELDRCMRCGLEAMEGIARFNLEAGGLLCAPCAEQGGGGDDAVGPRVGPVAREHLRALATGTPPDPLPGAAAHFGILDRFALLHLGLSRPFRSVSMVRTALASGQDDPTSPSAA